MTEEEEEEEAMSGGRGASAAATRAAQLSLHIKAMGHGTWTGRLLQVCLALDVQL